ncbi:MAG: hypothetical protein V4719_19645 [Planctomycetota bacterium]
MDLLLPLIFRWIHIGSAITVVGGSVFMIFVLLPAAKEIAHDEHLKLRAAVLKRWKWIVHGGVALFLISGFYNYIAVMAPQHKGDGLYHALMGVKMLLAMGVFGLAEVLVGRSKLAEKLRQNGSKFLLINLALAVVIIMLSGFLKSRGVPVKSAPVEAAVTAATSARE